MKIITPTLLFILSITCIYQQLLLRNQEVVQKAIVEDLIRVQAELNMYVKTDLIK